MDRKISEVHATSNEINKINQNLIDGVKILRTLGIAKTLKPSDLNKGLFTSDDLYSLDQKNDLEGNVFKQTEKDILELLIEKPTLEIKMN